MKLSSIRKTTLHSLKKSILVTYVYSRLVSAGWNDEVVVLQKTTHLSLKKSIQGT